MRSICFNKFHIYISYIVEIHIQLHNIFACKKLISCLFCRKIRYSSSFNVTDPSKVSCSLHSFESINLFERTRQFMFRSLLNWRLFLNLKTEYL